MIEKREHLRLPIIHQIGEPIDMMVDGKLSQGVIIDLSAGGMLILGRLCEYNRKLRNKNKNRHQKFKNKKHIGQSHLDASGRQYV